MCIKLLILRLIVGKLTSSEDLPTAVTAGCELGVVAVAAVDFVQLGAELLVHQGHSALVAEEAGLVPMFILVRQILKQTDLQFTFTLRDILKKTAVYNS